MKYTHSNKHMMDYSTGALIEIKKNDKLIKKIINRVDIFPFIFDCYISVTYESEVSVDFWSSLFPSIDRP